MRTRYLLAGGFLALAMSATAVSAQTGGRTRPDGADGAARREWMKEHHDAAKQRWENLTPAQREAFKEQMKAYSEERKSLMEQVKAGKIDKKTAAEQLKAWREAHKPAKP